MSLMEGRINLKLSKVIRIELWLTCLEEFFRRVTEKELEEAEDLISFWVKMERCDFSSNDQVLKMVFEKIETLYKSTIGAKNLSVPLENIDLDLIDFENFGDIDLIDDQISIILKFVNKEEFLILNKIFFYCMRVSDGDFQFADFLRNLKII